MAVMGAVVAHKQLGIYVYGCGIEQENGFCVAGITVPSGVLFHRQLSLVLEQCRGPARKALGSLL